MTTPAVVRQRLRLASVSPKLHEVYAEDGMSLEQLMAFAVYDNEERRAHIPPSKREVDWDSKSVNQAQRDLFAKHR